MLLDIINVLLTLIGCGFGLGVGMVIAFHFTYQLSHVWDKLVSILIKKYRP